MPRAITTQSESSARGSRLAEEPRVGLGSESPRSQAPLSQPQGHMPDDEPPTVGSTVGSTDAAVEGLAVSEGPGSRGETNHPLAPFASSTYRMFWAASLFSNVGTWVHEIGAGWLMSTLDGSPLMVSAVRTATALPMVLLAIPAGALSDRIDRRKMLMVVQCWLIISAGALALLTWSDRITPTGLLLLTIVMGVGAVMHVPTWQASIPEIVDRQHLTQAIALGSVSFNLARSVGPAVGGLLIVAVGLWAPFAVNAISFAFVLLAVFLWRRTRQTPKPSDGFFASMTAGLKMVAAPGEMRRTLVRVAMFVLPASSLWGLLPLIVRQQLAWDAKGYGYLVGAIGLGAVLAAVWLPRLRVRLGADRTIVMAMLGYAAGLAMLAASTSKPLALIAATVLGTGWMAVLTTLNANAQFALPDAMRARGMACYLSAFATAMAVGSIVWGRVAADQSPAFALGLAAGVLALLAIPAGGRVGT